MATKKAAAITIPPMNFGHIDIVIIGDSPLVVHKWSEKARQEMRDKQTKQAKTAKVAKDPWMCFCESLYWLDPNPMPEYPTEKEVEDATFGFRSISLKAAAVTACTQVDGMTKVAARQLFHIDDEYIVIDSGPPSMREDMVRVGMGTADLRYRGEFTDWRADFTVKYNADAISAPQIVNLFQRAGFGVGLLEHRPEKDGSRGRFHVATTEEIK